MKKAIVALAAVSALLATPFIATAQTDDAYIGEVRAWANNFCPYGWARTDGQIIAIQDNPALYSLIGTQYGGNGQSTFGLPDMRGRTPVGWGTSSQGLTNWIWGEYAGTEYTNEVPQHSHPLYASAGLSDTTDPQGHAIPSHDAVTPFQTDTSKSAEMMIGAVSATGIPGGVENRQPATTIQYCIALTGTYPSHN